MEYEGSFASSQIPAISPYPKPDESSPLPSTLFNSHLNLIYTRFSRQVSPTLGHLNICSNRIQQTLKIILQ
jgi:hypothetical protein